MNPHSLNWRDNVDFVEPPPLLSSCYPLAIDLLHSPNPAIPIYLPSTFLRRSYDVPTTFLRRSYDVRTISDEIVRYKFLIINQFKIFNFQFSTY